MADGAPRTMLDVLSFGAAVGTTAAIYIFLLGLSASLFGWGIDLAIVLSTVFVGFGPTVPGALAGAVWGFFDGFIAGALISWLYNRFLLKRHRHMTGTQSSEHTS